MPDIIITPKYKRTHHRKPKKKADDYFYQYVYYSLYWLDSKNKRYIIDEDFQGIKERSFKEKKILEFYYQLLKPKKIRTELDDNGRKRNFYCARKRFPNKYLIKKKFTKKEAEENGMIIDYDYLTEAEREELRLQKAKDYIEQLHQERIEKILYERLI